MLNEVENKYTKKKIIKPKRKIYPKTYIVRNSDAILEVNTNNKIVRVILDINEGWKEDEVKNNFRDKLQNSNNLIKQNKNSDNTKNKKSKKDNYYVSNSFDCRCQSSTSILDGGNITIKTVNVTKSKFKILKDGMHRIRKIITENVQSHRYVKVYDHRKIIYSQTTNLNKHVQNINLNREKKDFNKINNYLKNSNNLYMKIGSLVDTENTP